MQGEEEDRGRIEERKGAKTGITPSPNIAKLNLEDPIRNRRKVSIAKCHMETLLLSRIDKLIFRRIKISNIGKRGKKSRRARKKKKANLSSPILEKKGLSTQLNKSTQRLPTTQPPKTPKLSTQKSDKQNQSPART